jgi:hypothetical protein
MHVVSQPWPKLAFKFFGPFKVLQRIGSVAYKLDLPEDAQVHPVFHVSQLKPFTANYSHVFVELPKLVDLAEKDVEPATILDRRMVRKGNHAVPQVLIRWTNLAPNATTWEDYHVMKKRFPTAIAWGQAMSEGGEDVRDAIST